MSLAEASSLPPSGLSGWAEVEQDEDRAALSGRPMPAMWGGCSLRGRWAARSPPPRGARPGAPRPRAGRSPHRPTSTRRMRVLRSIVDSCEPEAPPQIDHGDELAAHADDAEHVAGGARHLGDRQRPQDLGDVRDLHAYVSPAEDEREVLDAPAGSSAVHRRAAFVLRASVLTRSLRLLRHIAASAPPRRPSGPSASGAHRDLSARPGREEARLRSAVEDLLDQGGRRRCTSATR